MQTNLIALLVIVPVGIGIINLVLPRLLKKILNLITMIYLVYAAFNLMALHSAGQDLEYYFNNTLLFQVDSLALFTLIFLQVMGLIIMVFSLKGVRDEIADYFLLLYPITVGISNATVASVHSIAFMIFWGISGILLYLFALLGDEESTPDTARKTFLLIGGCDALLILGLILLRTLEPSAGWQLWNINMTVQGTLPYIAFFSLVIAAFTKAGVFPFHSWMPDFSRDTNVESAALLPASLDKLLGIYLLARLVMSVFELSFGFHLFLITVGALSIIAAVMMALIQHNGRKLLGYHAVSQVGYMVLGVGSGSLLAIAGGLFHLINNVIYKTGLFFALGSVEKQTGTSDLGKMGGLGRKMPLTLGVGLVSALAISGIPPLNGFFSKWMVYQGLLQKASQVAAGYQIWLLICLILAAFGSALTLASFLKFIHTIFLGRGQEKHEDVQEAPANQLVAGGILAVASIILGLFGGYLILDKLIYPVTSEFYSAAPQFSGLYQPKILLLLFAIIFLIGYLVFLMIKKVRYDEIYLGGMEALEKFRIAGTEFYKEVKDMEPLKTFYDWAEKKVFDIYDVGKAIALFFGKLFSRLHSGQLHFYSLWIIIGVLVFLWILK
ncbi:MAG TPA: proton-conducting transporter membrane subunit [bacterium]|nr:proton-conducting transporter membrane subunit [bacterium]